MKTTTIGLDLAKNVFQVHGVDAAGQAVIRKKLRRSQMLTFFQTLEPCLVGVEACATAHYWAREISALGHEVRLMPASYVKAYLRRQKNDAADAEAICEAVRRPTMRFVRQRRQRRLLRRHGPRRYVAGGLFGRPGVQHQGGGLWRSGDRDPVHHGRQHPDQRQHRHRRRLRHGRRRDNGGAGVGQRR
jgi:transposase